MPWKVTQELCPLPGKLGPVLTPRCKVSLLALRCLRDSICVCSGRNYNCEYFFTDSVCLLTKVYPLPYPLPLPRLLNEAPYDGVFVKPILMLVKSSQGMFIHQGLCAFVKNMPWFRGIINSSTGGNRKFSLILLNGPLFCWKWKISSSNFINARFIFWIFLVFNQLKWKSYYFSSDPS